MTSVLMIISILCLLSLFNSIAKVKNKTTLHRTIILMVSCLLIQTIPMLFQNVISEKFNIKPIYFEYVSYIGGMFIPTSLLYFSVAYAKKSITKISHFLLLFFPVVSLIVLWTNEIHNMFYISYSTIIKDTVFGSYFSIYSIYSYSVMAIGLILVLITTIKRSGFLSQQTMLIMLGALAPLLPNIIATTGLITMSVYVTPMLFTVTALCFYVSIFKLKALNVIPITLRTVIDNMSDAFIVISEDGTISDLNKTFVDKFRFIKEFKDKDNFFEALGASKDFNLESIKKCINKAKDTNETVTEEYSFKVGDIDTYFEADFEPVRTKDGTEFIATLIILRDITEAKKNMDIIVKNESLVILGELAGGVAHDINTPISAIKSGLLMLKDSSKTDDEKMLLDSMDRCADKIINLVNSLRNQIRNIGSNDVASVNVTTVVTDVSVILHNELVKRNVKLNLDIKEDLIVKGNSAKLSQVVTNIVVNAVQAYQNNGGEVNVSVYKKDRNAIIAVQDFAGGIPEHVRANIGKNILTTKGVNGTGFGLYLAYSVIKAAYGGEITFDTETGKGTTFYISMPM